MSAIHTSDEALHPDDELPTREFIVHVISDSLGDTAAAVAEAAAAQFNHGGVEIERLTKVGSIEQIKAYVDTHAYLNPETLDPRFVLFHTLSQPSLRRQMCELTKQLGLNAVDMLGPVLDALEQATGIKPQGRPGILRETDKGYFKRVSATEFAVEHDDGRNPEGLSEADIVLIGVSRTSKTPTSMYLATRGYRVANIPLVPGIEAPHELFDVDPRRIFGLLSTPEVLSGIRAKRLGDAGAVARSYAEPTEIADELDQARTLMRRLGCIVIHTDNRAIEETAQEILRYFESSGL